MNPAVRKPGALSAASRERWILMASGVLALAPYVLYHALFARLYWFGDEFDLVDAIDRLGFWPWLFQVYGENLVPVFKLVWGGGLLAFGGSYCAMMTVVWLVHGLNVFALGRMMRACGLPWASVFLALVVFGLTPATIETLAWSVQLSSMLSVTFMLLAMDSFFRSPFRPVSFAWTAASALTFVRGVLTGPMLACAVLWPGTQNRERLERRIALAAAYLLPAVVVGVAIVCMMPKGGGGRTERHVGESLVFGTWYFCLNPAYHLLRMESWGPRTVVLLGVLKGSLVVWTLARSRGSQRVMFALLFGFDLSYAVLLGIGRYHTGIEAAVSSRYQYASLVALMPALGFWFERLWTGLPAAAVRRVMLPLILAAIGVALCAQWSAEIDNFSTWRGTDSRRILASNADAGANGVPGYPGFPIARAKVLIARYNLH